MSAGHAKYCEKAKEVRKTFRNQKKCQRGCNRRERARTCITGSKAEKEEPPALQQEREINLEKDNSQNREPVQEQEQQPEGVFHEIKEEPRRKRVKKPLSQMNIEEKVDFLTSLPHNMPRALCLIEADGKTYRGIIMERKDNMVVIRTAGGGNPVELAIGDISSIHPLGF
ncbi:CotO family spore coat protein [Bacillus stratosphericus]|nr:CotO family spore coat protein [Bacillus stratosphericus]